MSDIGTFFERYAERYMASDVGAVSAMYEAPMLALREGLPSTSPTGRPSMTIWPG
jgi:hypothetical protein